MVGMDALLLPSAVKVLPPSVLRYSGDAEDVDGLVVVGIDADDGEVHRPGLRLLMRFQVSPPSVRFVDAAGIASRPGPAVLHVLALAAEAAPAKGRPGVPSAAVASVTVTSFFSLPRW